MEIVARISDVMWGVPTMGLLLAVGVCMTWVTGGVQFRKLGASFRQVRRSLRSETPGVSSFQAVCTALAATVGTGNIAGVAGAIALGGPGVVFWMWLSAFLGMATKYAEVVLAVRYRKNGSGGPMYYMEDGMGRRWLAAGFSFFAMLASFGMGNMAQANTIAGAVQAALPQVAAAPLSLVVGLAAAALVLAVTMGGAKQVGRVMEQLVPVVTGGYLICSLVVIFCHWQRLPMVLGQIVREAFYPRAAVAGGMWSAVRWGISRGIFSNEAGLGSAPMAHAAAQARPQEQGLMGIFEVFFDTVVLCTLTALTILTSGVEIPYGKMAGAALATTALETVFGSWAAGLSAICLALLALGTLISWQLYGEQCAGYLFGEAGKQGYRVLYPAAIVLGATMELSIVWAASDICNALMVLPNLAALLALRKEVEEA